mmetsp:Transcript_12772/g.39840  ORF Transcript_12772/g.39840 Transcript_12772/m.39840 type:complete len:767 (-) Transcript_12772:454-2754(-)
MSGPARAVRLTDDVADPSPLSVRSDGGTFCKKFTEKTRAPDDELRDDDDGLSECGSESTDQATDTASQGLDSWSLADASWSPMDMRTEPSQPSPASLSKRPAQPRRPSVISEEQDSGREGEEAGGQDGSFMRAAGGAAATAAAAAAAANAVAAQQRLDQQQQQRRKQQSQKQEESKGVTQLPNVPHDDKESKEQEDGPTEEQFQSPPGLLEPAQFPSRGSGMHCSGDCSPCVWHWKPQGCFRGRECGYCHLCPEGEIKMRKKAKLATLRSGPRGALDASEDKEQQAQQPEDEKQTDSRQGVPSVGSALHGSGECRPCAWFWKLQGCQNGQECRHCHLCPEGEIKLRKKLKVETMRRDQPEDAPPPVGAEPPSAQGGLARGDPVKVLTADVHGEGGYAAAIPPPPGLSEPAPAKIAAPGGTQLPSMEGKGSGTQPPPLEHEGSDLPSVGSLVHGSGECRPCAWFWKPQGCQNGAECRHCHLCPEGEIKTRKKEKAETLRQERQQLDQEQDNEQQQQQHGEEGEQGPEALALGQVCASPASMLCLPLLPPPLPLPSIGSSLHGTGLCRPCAWFWKPQGCENGAECCHCHLCPSGEIKARRRMKVAMLRHQGSLQEQLELQQEEMGQWEAQWEAQQQVAGGFLLEQPSPEGASPDGGASPSPEAEDAEPSRFMMPVPLDLSASLESPLPSTGSALHSLGKCRPCAWFWKTNGCLNGQACAHCHLCPEGELKVRKKVKETAMRIGALLPARQGLDSRSPRVVKIAPVLGA